MSRPLLLGHRGARAVKSIAENTLQSFDRALADGCDGFEFDVRLTADRKAVVCHDPEFKGLEIGRVDQRQLSGMPQLTDVLVRYHDRAFLDIELKVAGLEKITSELLGQFPPQQGFVVSSFLPDVLLAMHAQDSAIPLGLICETNSELREWSRLPIEYLIPHHTLISADLMAEVEAASKKVLVWTVNMASRMSRLAGTGVAGIISDDTELVCRTLKS